MYWYEQSGHLQLHSFIREDRASRFYRFLVCIPFWNVSDHVIVLAGTFNLEVGVPVSEVLDSGTPISATVIVLVILQLF